MNDPRKLLFKTALLIMFIFVCGGLVLGSLWQIEITILNQLCGWGNFFIFFALIECNNWIARDFFYVLIAFCFPAAILAAFKLGEYWGRCMNTDINTESRKK